jgi:hypothetical protein
MHKDGITSLHDNLHPKKPDKARKTLSHDQRELLSEQLQQVHFDQGYTRAQMGQIGEHILFYSSKQ